MIDITTLNLNVYSSEELLSLASKGLLACGKFDLTAFLDVILEGLYTEEDFEAEQEKAEEASNALEEAREKVREAVEMLERI